jgi:hypothetical protein
MTLRNHTMRDLLSKLDALVSETALKDKADLEAKRQALGDLESDPVARKDPEISAAIAQRRIDLEKEAKSKGFTEDEDLYQVGDDFGISFSEDFEIATEIVDILEDGIVVELDETAIDFLEQQGFTFEEIQLGEEKKKGVDGKACWKGYRYAGKEQKADGSYKDKCVKVGEELDEEQTDEAKYQGREVPLGKPMKGDVKKSKVYVKNAKGNVVKVNFGDKKMRIKKSNPNRRKSFRARHNCKNPGPRWKARYWSCRAW